MSRRARWEGRLYGVLLRTLPRGFRAEYGAELRELFEWQVSRLRGRGRLRFWLGAVADLAKEAVTTRRAAAGRVVRGRASRRRAMDGLFYDARQAARGLLRRPGLTLPLVLTLGLGIGLATAMVAVTDGVLLQPLKYPDADRLVLLRERTERGSAVAASYANFADWRAQSRAFDGMAAVVGPRNATVLGVGEAQRAQALFVSADYFEIAGTPPQVGRLLGAGDADPSAPAAVVVSHDFWQRALGGRRDLTGVSLVVQDLLNRAESHAVVGVLPPAFDLMGAADIYLPLDRAVPWNVRGNHVVWVLGRLTAGTTTASAERELAIVQARIREAYPGETEAVGVAATALREEIVGSVRTPVLLLLTGAALLLLAAFLNAAGALLARGVARRQELLIRGSLGATRTRLVRQLLIESVLLGAGGLVVGLGLARLLLVVLVRREGASLPRVAELDGGSLVMIAAAATLAGIGVLLFGTLSALLTTRGARSEALRVGARGTRRGPRTVWQTLIAAEVALALMLLSAAGVLGRSLWRIMTADTGFDAAGVVTAQVNLPSHLYGDAGAATRYFEQALEALRASPDIESAGLGHTLPLPGVGSIGGPVELVDGVQPDLIAQYRVADDGFFRTLRIELLRGRLFDARDVPGAPHAAVVNATLADALWPGMDPIGQRFYLGGMDPYREDWLTVVGVVAEARPWSSAAGTVPTYYVAARQRPAFLSFLGADLLARGRDAGAVARVMRERLTALDDDVPARIRPLEERIAAGTADRRFVLSLLALFACLALASSAVGIWGVVSFIVSRTTHEAGIRLALGARPAQLLRALQARTALPVAAGVLLGFAGAALLIRLVRSLLFGVGPFDPVTFLGVGALIAVTAWAASYIPARRIRRLDPTTALRAE
jgi:putative ABC transport system permease protein